MVVIVIVQRQNCALAISESRLQTHAFAVHAVLGTSSSRMRTRLYAVAAKVKTHSTRAPPRCRSLRSSAMVFTQPNGVYAAVEMERPSANNTLGAVSCAACHRSRIVDPSTPLGNPDAGSHSGAPSCRERPCSDRCSTSHIRYLDRLCSCIAGERTLWLA